MSIETVRTNRGVETDEFSTLQSFSMDQLPSLTSEGLAAHVGLNDAISDYYKKPTDEAKQTVTANAHNLAAQILPQEKQEELNIEPTVKDMSAFFHPPTVEEALALGTAWDITQDPTTFKALEASIPEIPVEEKITEVKVELLQETLEKVKDEYEEDATTFTSTYVKAVTELEDLVPAEGAEKPNVYLDLSSDTVTQEYIGSMNDPSYEERMERLVRPIGAAFLRASAIDGKTAVPAVHFPPQ